MCRVSVVKVLPVQSSARASSIGRPVRCSLVRLAMFPWRSAGIVIVLLLGGCSATPVSEEFRSAYAGARDALEAGDYITAVTRYEDLLPALGDDRIGTAARLDYAHALLRAGQPERALAVARELEALDSDPAVSGRAALVAAIAEHESAERIVAQGAPYEEAQARARAAFRRLDHLVRYRPQSDPEGLLVARMRKLRETLAELEIAQVRAELEADSAGVAAQRAAYVLREFADTAAVTNAQDLLQRALGEDHSMEAQ